MAKERMESSLHPDRLMTRAELCQWWGVGTSAITNWVQAGLPEIKLTEKLRFYDVHEVNRFIREYAAKNSD